MGRTILGALVGVGLVMAAVAVAEQRGEVYPQRGARRPQFPRPPPERS